MNYSTLLRRSVDFDEYAERVRKLPPDFGLYAWYPNELRSCPLRSMMQLLWNRGETNGYAHHITSDPLANTNAKPMLMQAELGDHQVANITAEVEARRSAQHLQAGRRPRPHWGSTLHADPGDRLRNSPIHTVHGFGPRLLRRRPGQLRERRRWGGRDRVHQQPALDRAPVEHLPGLRRAASDQVRPRPETGFARTRTDIRAARWTASSTSSTSSTLRTGSSCRARTRAGAAALLRKRLHRA